MRFEWKRGEDARRGSVGIARVISNRLGSDEVGNVQIPGKGRAQEWAMEIYY